MRDNAAVPAGLPMYFGDFGGILVPDAFTPDFFSFAEKAAAAVSSSCFRSCMEEMLKKLPAMKLTTVTLRGRTVQCVRSQALHYMVAGHLALAKILGSQYHYMGMNDGALAMFAAEICRDNDLHCHITLSRELSDDEMLRRALKELGAEVDDTTCGKLYNRPQAYAFQRYLGDRANSGFIPVGANLGAYPYPALSGYFAGLWGDALRKLAAMPDTVAVTMLHGNAAVGAFRAYPDCRRVTVEQPVCQQYHGEFCGCSLLMTRTAAPREFSITLAPELTEQWRMAKVIRLGAEDYCEAAPEAGLSSEAVRAVELMARRLPEAKYILLVEGENE